MNLRAAPEPQGRWSGLSNVFPNRMSSAECGCKNRPWDWLVYLYVLYRQHISTLHLNTPCNALSIVSLKILRLPVESFDIRDNEAVEHVRGNFTRRVGVDKMGDLDEIIRVWAGEDTKLRHVAYTSNGKSVAGVVQSYDKACC